MSSSSSSNGGKRGQPKKSDEQKFKDAKSKLRSVRRDKKILLTRIETLKKEKEKEHIYIYRLIKYHLIV